MDLFLVRHGPAVPRRAGRADATRALTPAGRALLRAHTLPHLRVAAADCDRLLHSPWRRAAETATVLAELCPHAPEPLEALARAPRLEMGKDCAGARVILVGHQPWLTELAALLCFGGDAAAAAALRLPKGGILWLRGDFSRAGMRLRALWPPAR